MKKRHSLLAAALILSLASAICGCSKNDSNGSAQNSAVSYQERSSVVSLPSEDESSIPSQKPDESKASQTSEESEESREPSKTSQISEVSQTSAPVKLPVGVSRASKGKLKYTSSVLSLNAVFPEEFCILNTDYIPKYGIYLQNAEGTATLLAESVEDTTLTYRQMSEYLKSRYPDARVYTTDRKDVICKMTTTDQSGNEIYVFQRIKVKNGGYNEIALCCRPEESAKYEKAFNETSLS